MKSNLKKLACLVVSFSLIASAAACSKKDDKKESSGCTEVADTFLDAVVSLDSKKIKKLEKNLGVDGEIVDALTEFAENDYFTAVMEKASYEIDEDSVSEKKKKASCEATVKIPDYETAFEDADGDYDDFVDAIDSQKEKKYQEVTLTLEFEIEDDEYTLSNAEDVLADLYEPMADVLTGAPVSKPTEPTDGPASTDPEPTNTEPVDTTKPTDDPTDTTPSSSEEPTATISDLSVKKVGLSADAFKAALEAVDEYTGNSFFSFDSETDLGNYKATNYCMGYSEDFGNFYYYYEFASNDDAKGYFNDSTIGTEDYTISRVDEGDWGYAAYQFYSFTYVVYYSDNGLIYVGSESTESSIKEVETFIKALCGA